MARQNGVSYSYAGWSLGVGGLVGVSVDVPDVLPGDVRGLLVHSLFCMR